MVNSNKSLCVICNCQRPRKGKVIEFSSYVAPACLPKKSNRVTSTFRGNHCEIAGWGMQVFVSHSLKLWRCGYIVCYCILCTRSTTTPAAIRPPSGRQRLRFPSPHHLTATFHSIQTQTTIIHFRCHLFCLKGWNSAEQQVQLALWTRRCKDWKILRGGKSWCLSGDHSLK